MIKPTCPLPDIREARIDPSLPVNERLQPVQAPPSRARPLPRRATPQVAVTV